MNTAITPQATKKETINPTQTGAPPTDEASSWRVLRPSYKVAAPKVGSASRNENSAAVAVESPVAWPATIVHIERDAPGQSEKHWPSPMISARPGVTYCRPCKP